MPVEKRPKLTYFIGIDISRNELDFAIMQGNSLLFHREIENTEAAVKSLIDEFKLLPKFRLRNSVFCMENTGIYGNHLIKYLKKIKANIVVENALRIKNSLGIIRGKFDKIDAIRIAHYSYINRETIKFLQPKRLIIEQLQQLSTLRNRLKDLTQVLNTPINEGQFFLKKSLTDQNSRLCKASITAVNHDLTRVNAAIAELIKEDNEVSHLKKIITSVPSIGDITAIQIIISTNEFKDVSNARQFACYAGIAPFKNESGTVTRKARVSKLGNKKMKALLHLCALSAVRSDGDLKTYYQRKTKIEGKPAMSVLNAVRNKLILRVFSCVNGNRLYSKEFAGVSDQTTVHAAAIDAPGIYDLSGHPESS